MALNDLDTNDIKVYDYLKANDFVENPWSTKKAATALKMKEDDVYEVVLERALELLAQEKKASRRSKLLKDFGDKSKLKKEIGIYEGKYGPYIKFGSKNIGLPDDIKSDEEKVLKLTLKQVEKIIEEKKKK